MVSYDSIVYNVLGGGRDKGGELIAERLRYIKLSSDVGWVFAFAGVNRSFTKREKKRKIERLFIESRVGLKIQIL